MRVHTLVEVRQVAKEPVKGKMETCRQRAVMCIDQGLHLGLCYGIELILILVSHAHQESF